MPGGPRARPQVRDWGIARCSLLGPRARSDTEGHEGTRAELAPDEREMRRKQTLRPRLATQGKSTDSITLTHPRPQAFQSTEATPTCCLCPGHPSHPRLPSHTPCFASLWQHLLPEILHRNTRGFLCRPTDQTVFISQCQYSPRLQGNDVYSVNTNQPWTTGASP